MKKNLLLIVLSIIIFSCERNDQIVEPTSNGTELKGAESSSTKKSNLREIVVGNGEIVYSFDKYGIYVASTANTPLTLTVTNYTASAVRLTFELATGSTIHGTWGVPGAVKATSVISNTGNVPSFESDSKLTWSTGFISQGQSKQITLNMQMNPAWGVEEQFGAIIVGSSPAGISSSLDFTDDQCYFVRGFN